jgi:hypothetical protein
MMSVVYQTKADVDAMMLMMYKIDVHCPVKHHQVNMVHARACIAGIWVCPSV